MNFFESGTRRMAKQIQDAYLNNIPYRTCYLDMVMLGEKSNA